MSSSLFLQVPKPRKPIFGPGAFRQKLLSPYSARLVKTERRKIFRVIESDLAPVVLCREKKQKESRTPLTQDLWDIARLDDSIHNT